MSTLNTQNITNGTDSITVEGAVKGSAKAWVNFNGTGVVAIRASYNVSSITDNTTGDYTVNFTNAFADANYCYTGSCRSGNNSFDAYFEGRLANSETESALRIFITDQAANAFDPVVCNVAVFR